MTAIDHVREVLHIVAGLLMWPVMVGLLGLAAAILVTLGAYLREAFDRWRGRRRELDAALGRLETLATSPASGALDLRIEKALQDEERKFWKALAQLRLAVRVGPALGLMGTLIPMAYALGGLSEGNLPALASNMVTAFAATVIGLAISVVAYLIAASREAWVRSDTQALSFRAEELLRAASGADPSSSVQAS